MVGNLFPPQQIRLDKTAGDIFVTWGDGQEQKIPGAEIRRYCACSSCRSRQLVGVSLVTESASVAGLQLMGSAAVQISFADGHDRGVFPWPYLYAIAEGRAQAYLDGEASDQ